MLRFLGPEKSSSQGAFRGNAVRVALPFLLKTVKE